MDFIVLFSGFYHRMVSSLSKRLIFVFLLSSLLLWLFDSTCFKYLFIFINLSSDIKCFRHRFIHFLSNQIFIFLLRTLLHIFFLFFPSYHFLYFFFFFPSYLLFYIFFLFFLSILYYIFFIFFLPALYYIFSSFFFFLPFII